MQDDWITLPEAVARVCRAKKLEELEARSWLRALLQNAALGSRIALKVGGNFDGQPERNSTYMNWEKDLSDLQGEWWSTGNAEWAPNFAYRGIQVHAADLGINLGGELTSDFHAASPVAVQFEPGSRSRGGGRRPANWWPVFAEELAFYIYDQGIPAGVGGEGESQVIEAVFARMIASGVVDREPGRTTVQPVVGALLRRIRGES